MKKILFLIIGFYCLQLQAQNSNILKEFNSYFESQKEMETLETMQNKQDSLRMLDLRDSVLAANERIEDIFPDTLPEVEMIDSQLFIQKVQFPKEQVPQKILTHEKDWKKEFLITNQAAYKTKHTLDTTYQVFGWHPFWMGTAYESYNFSLLSMVAYFSYELNPQTGGYTTIHNWLTTALIDSAHAYNTKVLLSVTNFGSRNNHIFLSDIQAQKNLIRNLITLLKERNADGVNIDFEAIKEEDKDALNNFLIDLSTSLKLEDPEYQVTVAIPAIDFKGIYDIATINAHIDLFVIMGYEFHGSHSETAGPVAPLGSGNRWMSLNLERSVDEYLVAGVSPKKLLLGLPYYGVEWQTYDLKFPSRVKAFTAFHTYRNIKNMLGKYSCVIDEPSLSKYYAYRDANNNYRQLWFEDSTTLSLKYDWIKEKQIGGLGIWALGYDNGYTDLWQLLAKKFAYTPEQIAMLSKHQRKVSLRRTMNLAFRLMRNPRSVLNRPRPILMLFGGFFGVSMIGVMMFLRYGHRLGRLMNITMKGTLSLIIILGFAIAFMLLKYINVKEIYILLGGILLGLFLFYLFSRRFLSEKELP